MIPSPLEYAESFQIGRVEYVSPDQIKVLLTIEAPESVALNTGTPRPFPRVNGYVLIPSDDGLLVGQVEWITVEPSPYPKRRGMKDFGLVDLPYPLRKMSLNPLGTLRLIGDDELSERFQFSRGADALPSVGDPVLIPTQTQLRAIVESGEKRRVKIGRSPLAGNADVFVDPDRIFGRHLAILGNTGSGKSCSVAGLIRWSLEAIPEDVTPNARFIVLDPNGEYARAFGEESGRLKPRQFGANPYGFVKQLRLPVWFWNSSEWAAFAQASGKTQRPTLIHALRMIRDGETEPSVSETHEMRRFLRTIVSVIGAEKNAGSPWGTFPKPKSFFQKIEKWRHGLEPSDDFSDDEKDALEGLADLIDELVVARSGQYPHYDFKRSEVDDLLQKAREAHVAYGGSDVDLLPIDADIPREFKGASFLRSLEASAEILDVSEYVETMLIRIRTLLADSNLRPIFGEDDAEVTLDQWLVDYVGGNQGKNGSIAIIDLAMIPSEIIHIVAAVIARVVFEASQIYRRMSDNHEVLPTVLVMEEAHTFIRRYKADAELHDTAAVCTQVFERIAREGRKFGLGLVLASQRPSELSPTVLSQCNSFLLHRISNDRDQDLVNRYVPDNLKGLLKELPTLPSQNAILLGWASELPVLVRMNDLPKEHQPQSDDPDFWDVWTGKKPREIDWKKIAARWQGRDG